MINGRIDEEENDYDEYGNTYQNDDLAELNQKHNDYQSEIEKIK